MKIWLAFFLSVTAHASFLDSVVDLPRNLVRFRAKTICSCMFVEGRDLESCKELSKKGFPMYGITADSAAKSVTAGIGIKATARLSDDPRYGCQIL